MNRTSLFKTGLAALSLGTIALSPIMAESQLITNDHFADGGGSWVINSPKGASASTAIEKEGDDSVLVISVQNEDDKPSDIRIQRSFGDIEAGKEYRVKFKIKAATPNDLVGYIYPESASSKVLWRVPLKTDSDWREYSYTFKGKESATNCVLGFSQLGRQSNTYSFKDIELTADE